MELGSSVALSPFWAAVRRRHPDVDLVLLADDQPGPVPADGTGVSDADLAAAAHRVAAYATGAWAVATGGDELLDAEVGFGPAEHTVVARVRATTRLTASPMADLEGGLLEAGWRTARPSAAGGELLVAQRGGVDLRASYAATGVLSLSVESTPYAVGVVRARELVRS